MIVLWRSPSKLSEMIHWPRIFGHWPALRSDSVESRDSALRGSPFLPVLISVVAFPDMLKHAASAKRRCR